MTHPLDDTYDEDDDDCMACGLGAGCRCDEADRLDREEEERTCINVGRWTTVERCINPHYSHSRSECFTVEMARQAMEDAEAEAGPPPEEGP